MEGERDFSMILTFLYKLIVLSKQYQGLGSNVHEDQESPVITNGEDTEQFEAAYHQKVSLISSLPNEFL